MSGKTDEDKKENKNGKIMIAGGVVILALLGVIIFLIT